MQGVILIDKPAGWTSFDVVNYLRKTVAVAEGKKPKSVKVGHTGTLDPAATGLLVLLVGKEYTRRAQALSKLDKVYEVTMTLGETSTTGDREGSLTRVSTVEPDRKAIERVLKDFTGHLMQIPPAFSAIKVNGKRAYDLARSGRVVELRPRPVTVYNCQRVSYDYPLVRFECAVSSGTYIRSLVEDMGKALEAGAYMSGLRRTKIGDYAVCDARQVTELTQGDLDSILTN